MFFTKRNQKTPAAGEPAPKLSAQSLGDGLMQQLFSLKANWYKNTNIVKNNYELGLAHFNQGNIGDALFRFRLVTWLEPAYGEAWYYLGRSQLAEGKPAQAIASLKKALALKPGHELAAYFMALAHGRNAPAQTLPQRMPPALVVEHFDAVAATYNQEQLENFQYTGHTALIAALRPQLAQGRIDHVIVELGVGTGLCGSQLSDVAAHITGVDTSAKMLEQAVVLQNAAGKKTYDALINRDAVEFLKEVGENSVDIVLACQLLSYMGDARELFAQAARVAKPGGIFALTAEKGEGADYRFDATAGIFRYPADYLKQLAKQAGFTDAEITEADIYPDTKGLICLFGK